MKYTPYTPKDIVSENAIGEITDHLICDEPVLPVREPVTDEPRKIVSRIIILEPPE